MSLGLVKSAQDLLASALGLARTRLDLLSTELQELLARLVVLMIARWLPSCSARWPSASAPRHW